MQEFRWATIATLDPERGGEARLQFQSALQWIARLERSFTEPASGDDVALSWRDGRDAIATRRFGDGVEVEMRVEDLAMRFTEHGASSSHMLELDEHTPAHVEAWILIELLHRGLDRDRFSKALPYDVSDMMSGDAVEFSPSEHRDELQALGGAVRAAAAAIARAGARDVAVSARELSLEGEADGRRLGFTLGAGRGAEPSFYIVGADGRRTTLRASELPDQDPAGAVDRFFASGPTVSTLH